MKLPVHFFTRLSNQNERTPTGRHVFHEFYKKHVVSWYLIIFPGFLEDSLSVVIRYLRLSQITNDWK